MKNVVEAPVEESIGIVDDNIDLYKAYIKKVEWEFTDGIDDLLRTLNLSYLRVKDA
jgi:hypothetical protein